MASHTKRLKERKIELKNMETCLHTKRLKERIIELTNLEKYGSAHTLKGSQRARNKD